MHIRLLLYIGRAAFESSTVRQGVPIVVAQFLPFLRCDWTV
jgi:hypothetical protein